MRCRRSRTGSWSRPRTVSAGSYSASRGDRPRQTAPQRPTHANRRRRARRGRAWRPGRGRGLAEAEGDGGLLARALVELADLYTRLRRWPEAEAAARRASTLTGGGLAADELVSRIQRLRSQDDDFSGEVERFVVPVTVE